ncbi:MAG: ribonuclease HII [Galactobacter sp.]
MSRSVSTPVTRRGHEPDLSVERALVAPGELLACVDEVGRGSLAGPVSVGLVIIDPHAGDAPPGIRDSKDLSAHARQALISAIEEWVLAGAVGHASAQEIDAHGIVPALRLAGHRAWTAAVAAAAKVATDAKEATPSAILLDGSHDWFTPQLLDALTHAPEDDLAEVLAPVTTRVKADRDCAGVGAASVLAKVERDGIMDALDQAHPGYGWAQNKGYGTAAHKEAIRTLGAGDFHRRTWHLGA